MRSDIFQQDDGPCCEGGEKHLLLQGLKDNSKFQPMNRAEMAPLDIPHICCGSTQKKGWLAPMEQQEEGPGWQLLPSHRTEGQLMITNVTFRG